MNAKQLQANVQKFGSTLSAMVMPNIGVFIGWGVLAALFIDTGWIPNAYLNELVTPVLTYLLPVLIGYTAGYNVHGRRGGVIGAFATMGMVVGSDVTMLVGGMIMGPLAAWVLKKWDRFIQGKVRPGMEMLVDNFSLGLIGVCICVFGYAADAPVMTAIQNVLAGGVKVLTERNLLPFTALFVQPAQVLFLNNAINHGILVPLGVEQAAETGKSVLFLIEANGGYWVGLVAAYAVFGKGMAKRSAPGAVLIQFLGGIAETCFPYCLMNPLTILGPMAGNFFSIFILTTFDGGAVGPPSPGSVIAFYMMTPKDCIVVNTIAYFGSLAVSFVVTAFILKLTDKSVEEEIPEMDSASSGASVENTQVLGQIATLNKVIFACDAGMGSSAMGVSILRTRLQKANMHPEIDHVAVAEIPMDADVVVTNVNLAERAKMTTEGKIPILTLSNFMDQNEYNRIVQQIKDMMGGSAPEARTDTLKVDTPKKLGEATSKSLGLPLFGEQNIVLNASFKNKREAIEACADIFIRGGYTDESYKTDMIQRDEEASVYLGSGVAMPHGLAKSKKTILHSGICLIQVPEGVDFDGETAYVLIGVAGRGEEHVDILGHVGETLSDESHIEALIQAKSKKQVMEILKLDDLKLGDTL
ncbi:MAG: PTS mannitol transporter subunit IICBA [Clostridiales bacterium]|nr:PTS mannitol transporter subunit IICBA [Clostridiales bacterium]